MNLSEGIFKRLEEEIKEGYLRMEDDEIVHAEISAEAMALTSVYLKSILEKESFVFLSEEAYQKKIHTIFTSAFSGQATILYANGVGEVAPKHLYAHTDPYAPTVYLSSQCFIGFTWRLVELCNYQKHCPTIADTENQIQAAQDPAEETNLILWKEELGSAEAYQQRITTNLRYVVALNKYLLNDEQIYLDWLYVQNPFLQNLVSEYGYTQDINLLAKVLESRSDKKQIYLDDLLWHKGAKKLYSLTETATYDGVFRMHENTFVCIAQKIGDARFYVSTQNLYLRALERYLAKIPNQSALTQAQQETLRTYIVSFLQRFIYTRDALKPVGLASADANQIIGHDRS